MEERRSGGGGGKEGTSGKGQNQKAVKRKAAKQIVCDKRSENQAISFLGLRAMDASWSL